MQRNKAKYLYLINKLVFIGGENYVLRVITYDLQLIIDKLNVDKRFEVIPNKKDKDKDDYEPYELDLKLKSQIKETLPQYKDFDIDKEYHPDWNKFN